MNYVLILGAASDIGIELAKLYAANNYNLILGARSSKRLEELQADLKLRYNTDTKLVDVDLEDHECVSDLIKAHSKDLIGFVLMAGYLGDQELAKKSTSEALQIMNVNYTKSCLALEFAALSLQNKKDSFIVGVASVAGLRGRQSNYYYGSSKAGLIAFLSGLRNYMFAKGVHVMTVLPGFVDTKMTSHLDLPKLLTAQASSVAIDIYRSQQKKKNVIYTLFVWRYIMFVIRNIPELIFKRLTL